MWEGKNVTVFVTGGIAAFKAATLVRLFVKAGANVEVAMTKSACEFITPLTFQVLTKTKCTPIRLTKTKQISFNIFI